MSWRSLWVAAVVLAAVPWGSATAAPGGDVADWAMPDAEVAILFRRADVLADIVDAVEKRFDGVGPVDRAVKAWRAWEIGGVRPVARKWGPGLAPGRGLAIYGHSDQRVRLVIGADDDLKARSTLAQMFASIGEKVSVTPDGLQLGDVSLKCALRGGFLVCDREAPPAEPPGRPPWMKDAPVDVDGALLVYLSEKILAAMSGGEAPLKAAWAALVITGDRVELAADVALLPQVAQPMSMLVAEGGAATAIDQVAAETPFLLKLSFDGPKLMAGAERLLPPPPPPAKALWDATKASWSGDLTLSFDGSPTHPVLVLGLTSPQAGAAWMDALVATAKQAGVPITVESSPTHPALRCVSVRPPGTDGTLRVHYAVIKDALVFALVPADLERRKSDRHRPLKLPAAFAARGAHGLLVWDTPIFLDLPFFDEIWEGGKKTGWLDDLQIGAALFRALVGEMGVQVRPRTGGVHARMWWGVL